MKFWFSGVKSWQDAAVLYRADVNRVMLHSRNLQYGALFDYVFRDSDAYYHFKQGGSYDPIAYVQQALRSHYSFVSAPDVIGDAEATCRNWQLTQAWVKERYRGHLPVPIVPIYSWGSSSDYLHEYLQQSKVVGIGGLVPLMRMGKSTDRAEREQAIEMLRELVRLCRQHPQRLHIYGCNWLPALNRIKPYAYSCDSSVAWDGARYSLLIHQQHGRLVRVHSRKLAFDGTRLDKLHYCARSLNRFCNL